MPEHRHNGAGAHVQEENRAEACYRELSAVLERHRCILRAVLQVGADNTIVPVVQVAEVTTQEGTHGSNHHQ